MKYATCAVAALVLLTACANLQTQGPRGRYLQITMPGTDRLGMQIDYPNADLCAVYRANLIRGTAEDNVSWSKNAACKENSNADSLQSTVVMHNTDFDFLINAHFINRTECEDIRSKMIESGWKAKSECTE